MSISIFNDQWKFFRSFRLFTGQIWETKKMALNIIILRCSEKKFLLFIFQFFEIIDFFLEFFLFSDQSATLMAYA